MSTSPLPATNDTIPLTPVTALEGRELTFDFPALHIGVAEYAEGPAGCTVFYFPEGATGAVDIRGGAPGTILAGDGPLDALCFAGGSLYGLEAAAGVTAELFAMRRYSKQWQEISLVRGAIIFGFGRDNAIYPDKALGRAALQAAQPGRFPLGPRGAGCTANVGNGFTFDQSEPAGQGGAFRQVGPVKVAVFSVVNAIGGIYDRQGRVVRGHRDRASGERQPITAHLEALLSRQAAAQPAPGNTTLTAVVTNQKLAPFELTQLARQVHASMARAIQPFHTLYDDDVLYAVTTNEVENNTLNPIAMGVLASELAWDAVLCCFDP